MPSPLRVKVYSTSWCEFCVAEKKFLKSHNIAYEDINVEDDEAATREMVRLSGQLGVPFTHIEYLGGHQVSILGFNPRRLARALKLT